MIASLQSLRWFAIFAIFLSHLGFFENSEYEFLYKNLFSSGGPIGVSIFIVLSGFVITVKYYKQINRSTWKDIKEFVRKRIGKTYALHIVMLIVSLPFTIHGIIRSHESITNAFLKLLLNMTLLQSFIPIKSVYFSYNAVAWYLSTALFFYIMTFYIFNVLHKMVTGGGATISNNHRVSV